jgi:hypothetical protein
MRAVREPFPALQRFLPPLVVPLFSRADSDFISPLLGDDNNLISGSTRYVKCSFTLWKPC